MWTWVSKLLIEPSDITRTTNILNGDSFFFCNFGQVQFIFARCYNIKLGGLLLESITIL